MRRRVERETEGLRMLSASEERVESEGDIALNEKQKKKNRILRASLYQSI